MALAESAGLAGAGRQSREASAHCSGSAGPGSASQDPGGCCFLFYFPAKGTEAKRPALRHRLLPKQCLVGSLTRLSPAAPAPCQAACPEWSSLLALSCLTHAQEGGRVSPAKEHPTSTSFFLACIFFFLQTSLSSHHLTPRMAHRHCLYFFHIFLDMENLYQAAFSVMPWEQH